MPSDPFAPVTDTLSPRTRQALQGLDALQALAESATLPGTVGVRVSIPAGLVYAVDLYLSPGASAALDYRVNCRPAAP